MKKAVGKGTLILIVLIAVFLFLNALVITHAGEYKLIKQFGRVVAVVSEPGPSFKIPFIQEAQSIPKQRMISDLPPSDVTTRDKKVMSVDSFVVWSIVDPVKYLSTVNASLLLMRMALRCRSICFSASSLIFWQFSEPVTS